MKQPKKTIIQVSDVLALELACDFCVKAKLESSNIKATDIYHFNIDALKRSLSPKSLKAFHEFEDSINSLDLATLTGE